MTRVLLFGKLKAYATNFPLEIETKNSMTPKDVRLAVATILGKSSKNFPGISELESSAVATDRVLTEQDTIGEAREVSLLPPVCGG